MYGVKSKILKYKPVKVKVKCILHLVWINANATEFCYFQSLGRSRPTTVTCLVTLWSGSTY